MYNAIEITEQQVEVVDEIVVRENVGQHKSRFGVWAVMSVSALGGVWGVTCLLCGLAECNNLGDMGRSLLTAITGM